jgi:phenylpropionate dioxygenase-like ring-hydroxylating dioxygenase large terminal subunit
MLTMEKQSDLVQAGPGTPAGTYLRSFWQPVAMSKSIGTGLHRLTIMNEDLVAYRDGDAVRLLGNRCPHRGTTLHTGRLANGELQCAYHGWTFDGQGQCVLQPCEPSDSTFASKVRIPSYPTFEMHGIVFAYMGAGSPPPFPRPEHADRDDGLHNSNVISWECNYFQCLENNPDPMHTAFTHPSMKLWTKAVPKFVIEETDDGIHMQAIRGDYIRHTHFRFPNVLSITNEYWEPHTHVTTWIVPIDDTHALTFRYFFTPTPSWMVRLKARLAWRFLQHRLDEIVNEDKLVQEGQGVTADRTIEHLGTSDRGIIILRRRFEQGMRAASAAPVSPPRSPSRSVPDSRPVVSA